MERLDHEPSNELTPKTEKKHNEEDNQVQNNIKQFTRIKKKGNVQALNES